MPVKLEELLESSRGWIGTEAFVRDVVARRTSDGERRSEAFRSVSLFVPIERVMELVLDRLGMGTGAAVCIRRKALAEQRSKDRKVDRLMRDLEQALDGKLSGR